MIVEFAFDPADGVQLVVERIALAHHLLRALRIVPELGVFRLFVQLGETLCRDIDVKDASSAVPATA
jgi:hypothetical protein